MAFVLNSASCVAVGRFNPAILVPEWIVKQGILPDSEVELVSAMGSSTTSFNMCGLQWSANLARFEVVAEREGADPGDFVARVLERLEHTPMRAVGSNFRYSVTSTEESQKLYPFAEFGLLKRLESETRAALDGTTIAAFTHEDAVLRVTLVSERGIVSSADFNFNRDSLTAGDAAIAARRWSSDKSATHDILRTLVEG